MENRKKCPLSNLEGVFWLCNERKNIVVLRKNYNDKENIVVVRKILWW